VCCGEEEGGTEAMVGVDLGGGHGTPLRQDWACNFGQVCRSLMYGRKGMKCYANELESEAIECL